MPNSTTIRLPAGWELLKIRLEDDSLWRTIQVKPTPWKVNGKELTMHDDKTLTTSRGMGTTTRQIECAPKHSIYVWMHEHTRYPRDLAIALGRTDITVVGPHWLDWEWQGARIAGIVVDHAARLTEKQHDTVRAILDALAAKHSTKGANMTTKAHALTTEELADLGYESVEELDAMMGELKQLVQELRPSPEYQELVDDIITLAPTRTRIQAALERARRLREQEHLGGVMLYQALLDAHPRNTVLRDMVRALGRPTTAVEAEAEIRVILDLADDGLKARG